MILMRDIWHLLRIDPADCPGGAALTPSIAATRTLAGMKSLLIGPLVLLLASAASAAEYVDNSAASRAELSSSWA